MSSLIEKLTVTSKQAAAKSVIVVQPQITGRKPLTITFNLVDWIEVSDDGERSSVGTVIESTAISRALALETTSPMLSSSSVGSSSILLDIMDDALVKEQVYSQPVH